MAYSLSPYIQSTSWQCYVGKVKLERGIAAYKAAHPSSDDTFSTTWFPFYLNPDAPKQGIEKRQAYLQKFGPERIDAINERLRAVGRDVGIDFKFGGRTGNTRDSHRLIQLAKTKGPDVQTRLVGELFAGYFENERDITSHEFLQEAAEKAGLDPSEVRDWLESDKGGREVDEEVRQAQMKLISGVPNFTIQGKFKVRGAQDPEGFVRIFEEVKAMKGS
jgi:predicted DsbA family dithiol-disulfide isomerase